jgi:hypothetical protein
MKRAGASVAEIINLRRARKARARVVSEAQAAANRARHGRTKEEVQASRVENARRESALDGLKREYD